jgi:hypothetical protein
MSTNGAATTSSAVACDVSFQETAKRIYTAEMRREAAVPSARELDGFGSKLVGRPC